MPCSWSLSLDAVCLGCGVDDFGQHNKGVVLIDFVLGVVATCFCHNTNGAGLSDFIQIWHRRVDTFGHRAFTLFAQHLRDCVRSTHQIAVVDFRVVVLMHHVHIERVNSVRLPKCTRTAFRRCLVPCDSYGCLLPWRARCRHVSRSRLTGKSISASSTLCLLASRIWMCHCRQCLSSLFRGSPSSHVSCWRRRRVRGSVVQAGDPRALDASVTWKRCSCRRPSVAVDARRFVRETLSRPSSGLQNIMECDVGSRC